LLSADRSPLLSEVMRYRWSEDKTVYNVEMQHALGLYAVQEQHPGRMPDSQMMERDELDAWLNDHPDAPHIP
jgi:hypothetical protein